MGKVEMGLFIRQLRTDRGLTQKELADRLNVTDKTVSRWERGENPPDLDSMEKLAALFNVSTAELVSGRRLPEMENKAVVRDNTPSGFMFNLFVGILGTAAGMTIARFLMGEKKLLPSDKMMYIFIAVMIISAAGRLIMKLAGPKFDAMVRKQGRSSVKKAEPQTAHTYGEPADSSPRRAKNAETAKVKNNRLKVVIIAAVVVLLSATLRRHRDINYRYDGDKYFDSLQIAGITLEKHDDYFPSFADNSECGDIKYTLSDRRVLKEIKIYRRDENNNLSIMRREEEAEVLSPDRLDNVDFGPWGTYFYFVVEDVKNGREKVLLLSQMKYDLLEINTSGAVLNETEFHFIKNGDDYTLCYTDESAYSPGKKKDFVINHFDDFKYFGVCLNHYLHPVIWVDVTISIDGWDDVVSYTQEGDVITFRVGKDWSIEDMYVTGGGPDTSMAIIKQ